MHKIQASDIIWSKDCFYKLTDLNPILMLEIRWNVIFFPESSFNQNIQKKEEEI